MSLIWRVSQDGLDPEFLHAVLELGLACPYQFFVLAARRTNEEQAVLYAKYQAGGARAAPPGQSAHNYGKAVDVVLDLDSRSPSLQPSWNTSLGGWLWLRTALVAHPRLKSGWKFGDWPHIEDRYWTVPRYPVKV